MALALPPGLSIPTELSGVDISRHDSIVPEIVKINVTFIALVALVVTARMGVRISVVRALGMDDVLMLLAGISLIVFSSVALYGIKHGFGHHVWDLNLFHVLEIAKKDVQLLYVCQIFYATGLAMVKGSIIASYFRIFPNHLFRKLMYVTGVVVIAVWICSIFVTIFQCRPIQGAWDFDMPHNCVNIEHFFYAMAGFNIATDLILCTFPLPLFWKLHLPLRERVVVCFLFAFGLFATVASIMRLTKLNSLLGVDISYACISSLNWSTIELGTGIICASVPSLKPIVSRVLPGHLFSSGRTNTAGYHNNSSHVGGQSRSFSTPGVNQGGAYDMTKMSLPSSTASNGMLSAASRLSSDSLPIYAGGIRGKSEYSTHTRVYAGSGGGGGSDEETLFSRPETANERRPTERFARKDSNIGVRTDVEMTRTTNAEIV